MAAGLGYIEFSTGDILTAAVANGYLASQTVMVFADSSARSTAITSPQEGMVSYLKDTNAVEYYSGSAWAAVGGGGGGGGKVLQVVQASTTTETTVASTTITDTGLSATITPTSATSKILVLVNQFYWNNCASSNNIGSGFDIYRGATAVFTMAKYSASYFQLDSNTAAKQLSNYGALTYLDSPATTSATTYKTRGNVWETTGGKQVIYQWQNNPSVITLIEIGA